MARFNVDLPHDKDFHLFLCYESNKIKEVRQLVKDLEQNGIKCCYYERDFRAGCSVIENIYTSIQKSVNMLVVLSEEFVNSAYCLHELEEAMHLKIEGDYNLIPIKIEPCVIPECIRHLTYIDAEEELDTAHTKVIDAVIRKEIQTDNREARNGKHLQFTVRRYKTNCLAFSRYRLQLTDTERAKIWNSGFEISAKILDEIQDAVNGSYFIRWQHVWHHTYLIISSVCLCAISFLMMLFLLLLWTTSGKEKTNIYQPAGFVLIIGLPLFLLAGIIFLILNCISDTKERGLFKIYSQAYQILRDRIWRLSVENEEKTGAVFSIIAYNIILPEMISLNIMRYNFKICKEYFGKRLESREPLKRFYRENETTEECTTRLFHKFLRIHPDAMQTPSSVQRHKMANGAKCACLLVEEWLDSEL